MCMCERATNVRCGWLVWTLAEHAHFEWNKACKKACLRFAYGLGRLHIVNDAPLTVVLTFHSRSALLLPPRPPPYTPARHNGE